MRRSRLAVSKLVEPLERRSLLASAFGGAIGGFTPVATLPSARGLKSDLHLAAFAAYTLTRGTVANTLGHAPAEDVKRYGVGRGAASRLISVPTPDGTFARFRIVESTILAPGLAAANDAIHTYAGVGVDDPNATIRLDLTPLGFHAQVLTTTGEGAYYVDPYYRNDQSAYVAYYNSKSSADSSGRAPESFDDIAGDTPAPAKGGTAGRSTGTVLREYRTAVATTGEYAAFFGGTASNALAAVVTAMNRVDGVYESELSIRLTLVDGESSLIYTNADTDPYTNNDPYTLLSENQSNLDAIIGSGNYDLGHVFSTAGGGLAGLGVVGNVNRKAQGETGTGSPIGDGFTIDYVAHEMGHQFGANHTFNTASDSQRNESTAYEVGSGSTIMAYAGITGSNSDLQAHSDPYFAWKSLDEIITYVDGTAAATGTRTALANHLPAVSGGSNYSIPANTPFALTATGSDADGDAIYYSWEEADLGPATLLSDADNGMSPLFRVYNPTTSPTRSFPQLASILSGANKTSAPSGGFAEQLPTTSRTMNFVITARDQHAGGGGTVALSDSPVGITSVPYMVNNNVVGFGLTSFNATGATVAGGSAQTITWETANTAAAPIGTSQVAILMSTDGGQTFPITLAAATANDGTESVVMPYNTGSSTVRFKVAAVGNVYFDINDKDVTITSVAPPSVVPPSVAGTVYFDANGNGSKDASEVGLSKVRVYDDVNNNGVLDSGEKNATTDSAGNYKILSIPAGAYHIREVLPTGYKVTKPSTAVYNGTAANGDVITGDTFSNALVTLVIDDAQAVQTGTWSPSKTSAGYYGTGYLTDGNTAKGTKSITFTPTIAQLASYKVMARWTAGPNRANNVPVDITSAGGTTTVSINEQVNNNTWVTLGIFPFNPGTSGSVTIRTTGTNGYVIADAVQFVPLPDVVIDNTSATVTGAWTAATAEPGFLGSNYLTDGNAGKGTKRVKYATTFASSGNYSAYAWWQPGTGRATNVPFDILHNGVTSTVTMDQNQSAGRWVLLGTYAFNAGSAASVTIRNDGTDGTVIADAVRFVKA